MLSWPGCGKLFDGIAEEIIPSLATIRRELDVAGVSCALVGELFFSKYIGRGTMPDPDSSEQLQECLAGSGGTRSAYGLSRDKALYMAWTEMNIHNATLKLSKSLQRSGSLFIRKGFTAEELSDILSVAMKGARPSNVNDILDAINNGDDAVGQLLEQHPLLIAEDSDEDQDNDPDDGSGAQ